MPAVFGLQQLNSRALALRWILAPAAGGVFVAAEQRAVRNATAEGCVY
jgi:hypothetical protein